MVLTPEYAHDPYLQPHAEYAFQNAHRFYEQAPLHELQDHLATYDSDILSPKRNGILF